MILKTQGPFIWIRYSANELSTKNVVVQLPDGYTYERIFINNIMNISELNPHMSIHMGDHITFPVVNSKSPSLLYLYIADTSKDAEIKLTIEKFGQMPDPNYFIDSFKPILVTGEDGNKYNVIPSDQFK